ncbi:MAG: aminotransferase class IV [Puniceicoccales bacterium]|jgi:branched-subunit amino acid aminotransferase/4-amino-4-deoxychorismate lyase|nr:aminotransferase class IV [Puniceicoccales bacterium]
MKVYIDGAFFAEEDARISAIGNGFLKSKCLKECLVCRDGTFWGLDQRLEELRTVAGELEMEFSWPPGDIREALAVSYDRNGLKGKDASMTLILCEGRTSAKAEEVAEKKKNPEEAGAEGGENSADGGTPEEDLPKEKKRLDDTGCTILPSCIVLCERREQKAEDLLVPTKFISVENFPLGSDILQWERHCLGHLGHELAEGEARKKDASGAILVDGDGNVSGCTAGDIFVVQEKALLTPEFRKIDAVAKFSHGIIASDDRQIIQRKLSLQDIKSAKEVFVFTHFDGVLPLTSIDDGPIGDGAVGSAVKLIATDLPKKLIAASKGAF